MIQQRFGIHTVVAVLALSIAAPALADTPHGSARAAGDAFEAYDASTNRWLSPDEFWRAQAERSRGRHWGEGERYPPYADAAEHDTFLVVVDGKTCLMEFFHRRWRRANDVWRWNDRFNAYGACAVVFD
jgi:hypothetical protein